MKIFLILFFLSANQCLAQDIILVPETPEHKALKKYDENKDGIITESEAISIFHFSISNLEDQDFSFLLGFKNLKNLSIRANQLINHEDVIFQLADITSLTIYGKRREPSLVYPDRFDEFTNLEYLSIACLNYSKELVDVALRAPNLKELFLKSINQEILPSHINKLKSLERFKIMNSKVKDISAICECKNLRDIKITKTNLENIPDCIQKLQKLEKLDFSSLKITELPKSFSKLKNLKYLSLKDNDFQHFPIEILALTNLSNLSLGYFDFNMQVPEEIANLKRLKSFPIKLNKKFPIPKSLFLIDSLYYLDLSNYELSELPPEVLRLKCLKEINLNNNKIIELPYEITSLSALKKISLNNNEIVAIPTFFNQLNNLKVLELESNKISEFPSHLADLPALNEIKLGDNMIENLSFEEYDFKALKRLDLSKNKIKSIPITIGYLNNISQLNLSENPIKKYPSSICDLPHLSRIVIAKGKKMSPKQLCEKINRISYENNVYSDYKEKKSFTEMLFDPTTPYSVFTGIGKKLDRGDCSMEFEKIEFLGGKKLKKYKVVRGTTFDKDCYYSEGQEYIFLLLNFSNQAYLPSKRYSGPLNLDNNTLIDNQKFNNYAQIGREYKKLTKEKFSGKKDFYFNNQLMASGEFIKGKPRGDWTHYFLGMHSDSLVRSRWSIKDENNYKIEQFKYRSGQSIKSSSKTFVNGQLKEHVRFNKKNKVISRFDYSDPLVRVRNTKYYNKNEELIAWNTTKLLFDINDPLYKADMRALNKIEVRQFYDGDYQKLKKSSSSGWKGKMKNGNRVGTWEKVYNDGTVLSKTYEEPKLAEGFVRINVENDFIYEGKMEGLVRQGIWKKFSLEGDLISRLNYKNNNLEGEYVEYNNNIKSDSIVYNYHKGKKHGLYKTYKNGVVTGIGNFENGRKHGFEIISFVYEEKLRIRENFYEQGKFTGKLIHYFAINNRPEVSLKRSFLLQDRLPPLEKLIRINHFQKGYQHGITKKYENGLLSELLEHEYGYSKESIKYKPDGSYSKTVYEYEIDINSGKRKARIVLRQNFDKDGKLIN